MVTIEMLRQYIGCPPDEEDSIVELCLAAAKSKAKTAGIPDFRENGQYDLFLCALAALYYDNRSLGFTGTYQATAEETARKMVNSFVLELRYAEDGVIDGGEVGESG